MQRCSLLLGLAIFVAGFGGCKTAEVAMTHPATGVQIVARFESFEPSAYHQPAPQDASLTGVALLANEPFVVR